MSEYLELARSVVDTEIEGLQRLKSSLGDSFHGATGALLKMVEEGKKVVVIGIGKSGNIGHKIAATLNSTGVTAVVLNSQNALHGDLGLLSAGDVVLALSYSGETAELLDLLPFVKREHVDLIALTGGMDSTLASHADYVLDTSVEREACPHNLAPTASSTAMLVMGDALAMVLLKVRGFSADDFAKYHPGGSLGRALLTRVGDVMRTGTAFAKITLEADVATALVAMQSARSGACVICDDSGAMAGIFTHGDFARAFQTTPDLGGKPVKELMTTAPVTVGVGELAAEAVRLLGEHRIDDVIVLDEKDSPVGLVDSQDLARLKLI